MSYNHEKIRDTLIRYGTSQLTSHGSIVIGLSVILFAFFNLVNQLFKTPAVLEFPLRFSWFSLRYVLVLVIMGILMGGIICVLARFLLWGKILSSLVNVKDLPEKITLTELWNRIYKSVGTSHYQWFAAGVEDNPKGLIISICLGLLISFGLMWIFLFQ